MKTTHFHISENTIPDASEPKWCSIFLSNKRKRGLLFLPVGQLIRSTYIVSETLAINDLCRSIKATIWFNAQLRQAGDDDGCRVDQRYQEFIDYKL